MAGGARDEEEGDGAGPPSTAQPPWIRRDRSVQRFAARIAISVAIGVAVAAIGPEAYGRWNAPDTDALANISPAQWPECRRLNRWADACWHAVPNRETLTIAEAAGMLGVPEERLRVLNPSWLGAGTAPKRILIWRGEISGAAK